MSWKLTFFSIALSAILFVNGTASSFGRASSWQKLDSDTLVFETEVQGVTSPIKVWYYLPVKRQGKVPCVFMAPAGSSMFHGMNLADGDRPEHLPYVKSGFAVVAYEIEGPLSEHPTNTEAMQAAKAFMAARGGAEDGSRAISAALKDLKDIDANRLFAAGHSSAATTALALAAKDARIKASAACNPCTDVSKFLAPNMGMLNATVPGFKAFIDSFSPLQNARSLKTPVLLFTAMDDPIVPVADVQAYANALKKTNSQVKVVTVASGGHHDSMMTAGIPAAIQFFKSK